MVFVMSIIPMFFLTVLVTGALIFLFTGGWIMTLFLLIPIFGMLLILRMIRKIYGTKHPIEWRSLIEEENHEEIR